MTAVASLNLRSPSPTASLFNLEAEQSVIGCLLYDNSVHDRLDGLAPQHFHDALHATLYHEIMERIRRGQLAEPVELSEALKDFRAFGELGGIKYLADLFEGAYLPALKSHADVVRGLGLRRHLIDFCQDTIERAKTDPDGMAVLEEAEKVIVSFARGVEPSDAHLIDARSSVEETLAELEIEAQHGRPKGVMTGLRCIDRRLRGLRPGHLLIVAGRPSMGKTALARQAAFGCAARNPHHQIAFFALEMHRREINERTLSELSFRSGDGIPYQDMSGDKLDPHDRERLGQIAGRVPHNLIIDDTAVLSVEYVRRRVWALKRRGPLAAIFIDYLQIMQRPDIKGRNDAAVIGEMTASLKRLAREAEICVVLLSQINRGVEGRDDKRPQLSDLRESGAIEQDANAVLFPYREVYYLERAEPKDNSSEHSKWAEQVELFRRRMDVICAKNRQGAVGTDHQEYFAEYDAVTDVREERS